MAGQSYHNYGLAVDIAQLTLDGHISYGMESDSNNDEKGDWGQAIELLEARGFNWGGRWKYPDRPHFEKTFGFNWRLLLNKIKNKEVDENGFVIID